MNNGFYHEYPYRQDVSVSPEMEQVIGAQHINAQVVNSRVQYRIVRDRIPDDRMWTESEYLLLAQVLLPGQDWQDFTHPDRGGPTYDPGAEHMIAIDVHKIYPDAVWEGE